MVIGCEDMGMTIMSLTKILAGRPKGFRYDPKYIPEVGEECLVSGPNEDNGDGYVWGLTTLLWKDDIFVLYGRKGFWPVLHKWEHVLFKPTSLGRWVPLDELPDVEEPEQ